MKYYLESKHDLITLAISKELFSATPLQKIEIQSVLQTVAGRFHDEAKSKQIAFTIQSPKKPIAILAFEDGLDKILSNLISNAIKYTPEKGKVIVTLSRFKDKATIRVSDTGIGIPGDAIPKIWEEFFRAPNAKSEEIAGTGLGLSIVKQYVDLFDGKVNVQSSKGKGSTFEVVFDLKK